MRTPLPVAIMNPAPHLVPLTMNREGRRTMDTRRNLPPQRRPAVITLASRPHIQGRWWSDVLKSMTCSPVDVR